MAGIMLFWLDIKSRLSVDNRHNFIADIITIVCENRAFGVKSAAIRIFSV